MTDSDVKGSADGLWRVTLTSWTRFYGLYHSCGASVHVERRSTPQSGDWKRGYADHIHLEVTTHADNPGVAARHMEPGDWNGAGYREIHYTHWLHPPRVPGYGGLVFIERLTATAEVRIRGTELIRLGQVCSGEGC